MGAARRHERAREDLATAGPVRTCAGCGEKVASRDGEVVRVVRGPDQVGDEAGKTLVAFDLASTAFGRGAWVHPVRVCMEKAAKSGLSRAFKAPTKTDFAALSHAFLEAATRRVEGLLVTAKRLRKVAVGTDACFAALEGGARCVVVATDAKSVVERRELAEAISRGLAVSFGTKSVLGALMDRDEVALVAVTHGELGEEIKRTCRAAAAMTGSGSKAAWVSSEGR